MKVRNCEASWSRALICSRYATARLHITSFKKIGHLTNIVEAKINIPADDARDNEYATGFLPEYLSDPFSAISFLRMRLFRRELIGV